MLGAILGKVKEKMMHKKIDMDMKAVKKVSEGNTDSYSDNREVRGRANKRGFSPKANLIKVAKEMRKPKIEQGR